MSAGYKIGPYLASIQNQDGSWSGHHCITSATFTTAAAVLTLGSGRDAGKPGGTAPVAPKGDGWWEALQKEDDPLIATGFAVQALAHALAT